MSEASPTPPTHALRVGEHALKDPLSQLRRLAHQLESSLSTHFGFHVTLQLLTVEFCKCLHPLTPSLKHGERHWTLLRMVDFRLQVRHKLDFLSDLAARSVLTFITFTCFLLQKKHYNRILATYSSGQTLPAGLPPPGCGQEIPLAREQDHQISLATFEQRMHLEMLWLTQRRRQELMTLDKLQKQLVGLRTTSTCYMCRRVRMWVVTRISLFLLETALTWSIAHLKSKCALNRNPSHTPISCSQVFSDRTIHCSKKLRRAQAESNRLSNSIADLREFVALVRTRKVKLPVSGTVQWRAP